MPPLGTMRFRDRRDAGRRLADALQAAGVGGESIVLGLPRGGVVIAAEVAAALSAPLDVFIVRKLGVPGHEELAMGAIAGGGVRVLNNEILASLRVPDEALERVVAAERAEMARRERVYRGDSAPPAIAGRDVVLVDDGLATGATMAAAVAGLRLLRPRRIVVAVPVGSTEAVAALRDAADQVIALATPTPFYGVGAWYDDFRQTSDAEVGEALSAARARAAAAGPGRREGDR